MRVSIKTRRANTRSNLTRGSSQHAQGATSARKRREVQILNNRSSIAPTRHPLGFAFRVTAVSAVKYRAASRCALLPLEPLSATRLRPLVGSLATDFSKQPGSLMRSVNLASSGQQLRRMRFAVVPLRLYIPRRCARPRPPARTLWPRSARLCCKNSQPCQCERSWQETRRALSPSRRCVSRRSKAGGADNRCRLHGHRARG